MLITLVLVHYPVIALNLLICCNTDPDWQHNGHIYHGGYYTCKPVLAASNIMRCELAHMTVADAHSTCLMSLRFLLLAHSFTSHIPPHLSSSAVAELSNHKTCGTLLTPQEHGLAIHLITLHLCNYYCFTAGVCVIAVLPKGDVLHHATRGPEECSSVQ